MSERDEAQVLRRRLERERRARKEAESIAERVTSELYTTNTELGQANAKLEAANHARREAGCHEAPNPRVAGVAFTGSTAVARVINRVLAGKDQVTVVGGVPTHSISQADAAKANDYGTRATVLFITAGALVVIGGILFLVLE